MKLIPSSSKKTLSPPSTSLCLCEAAAPVTVNTVVVSPLIDAEIIDRALVPFSQRSAAQAQGHRFYYFLVMENAAEHIRVVGAEIWLYEAKLRCHGAARPDAPAIEGGFDIPSTRRQNCKMRGIAIPIRITLQVAIRLMI